MECRLLDRHRNRWDDILIRNYGGLVLYSSLDMCKQERAELLLLDDAHAGSWWR